MDRKSYIFSTILHFFILLTKMKFVLLSGVTLDTENEFVIKQTKHGKIKGFVSERLSGYKVEQFLGVPFAAPPVGDLRLERPLEPTPWTEPLDTLHLPPACLQKAGLEDSDSLEYIHEHVPDFSRESEDCLYLNLYKPKKPSKSGYPVLVFIHGGSNEVGMGAMFDGDVLAGFSEIIVITFNYRLGALGFYGAQEESLEGNYGFLDQIMVMKWVQENIKYFDGDPTKVTIDGHSAGAADVGFHIVSPLAKGMFRYAVMQSGSPLAFWAMSPTDWRKGYNINESDVKNPGTTRLKEHLKTLGKDTVKNLKGKHNPVSFISFPAVVDNHFLAQRPLDTFTDGTLNGESYLMSFTKDEGSEHVVGIAELVTGPLALEKLTATSMLENLDIPDDTKDQMMFELKKIEENAVLSTIMKQMFGPIFNDICGFQEMILHEYGRWEHEQQDKYKHVKTYIEMVSDFIFIAPMVKLANILSKHTNNIYLFSFDHVSELVTRPEWLGVPHGRDLFYQFGAPLVGHKLYEYSENDKSASRLMMTLVGNFVKYGKLTKDGVTHHPPYRIDTKVFNRLYLKSNNITIKEFKNFKPRKMAFWNTFLPHMKCPQKKIDCQSSDAVLILPQMIIYSICVITTMVMV